MLTVKPHDALSLELAIGLAKWPWATRGTEATENHICHISTYSDWLCPHSSQRFPGSSLLAKCHESNIDIMKSVTTTHTDYEAQ